MILPSSSDPTPRDLGPCLLTPGVLCLADGQPLAQVAGTCALLEAVVAPLRADDVGPTLTPAWTRWVVATTTKGN